MLAKGVGVAANGVGVAANGVGVAANGVGVCWLTEEELWGFYFPLFAQLYLMLI